MFNLLPDSFKDEMIKEYNLRRFLIVIMFVFFIQITFFIFLLPSWLISNSKEESSKLRLAQLESSKLLSESATIKTVVKNINAELGIIDKSLEYPVFTKYLDSILDKKTPNIKISMFSYVSNSSSTATVIIKGISATRDSLVEFKNSLDALKIFKSIDLPISNYAKDKDIEFGMNLII